MRNNALVLLSGGLDSTVCATMAKDEYDHVKALTIYYGQRHRREIQAAKKVVEYLGIDHEILGIPSIFEGSNSSLINHDIEHPDMTYAELNDATERSPAYVPFRNGLFLSVAAVVAEKEGFDVIIYGPHRELGGDVAYPDCSKKFNEKMAEAINCGTEGRVRVATPLIALTKTRVVVMGEVLEAPMHLSWTCYEDIPEPGDPCGKCAACKSRAEAFRQVQGGDET